MLCSRIQLCRRPTDKPGTCYAPTPWLCRWLRDKPGTCYAPSTGHAGGPRTNLENVTLKVQAVALRALVMPKFKPRTCYAPDPVYTNGLHNMLRSGPRLRHRPSNKSCACYAPRPNAPMPGTCDAPSPGYADGLRNNPGHVTLWALRFGHRPR